MTLRCYWNLPRSTNSKILQDYVDYLNEVFNQTITYSRLVLLNQRYITCFQNKAPLPLKLEPRGFLHFHQLVSVRSGKVIVRDYGYRYSLSSNPDNAQQWIFRYEYSLSPEENVPHAHLHLNASRGKQQLSHIHFPTARVSIEQVIAHLVIEHEVKPKRGDWLEYLSRSHKGFTQRRTDLQSTLFP